MRTRFDAAPVIKSAPLGVALALALGTGDAQADAVLARVAQPIVSPDRLEDAQRGGDSFEAVGDFAWRAFIAMNWPAVESVGSHGVADREKAFAGSGPRVWETYKSLADTSQADAGANACGISRTQRSIIAREPFAEFNQPSFSAQAPANPLVAQNGEYVRYETRFNALEYSTLLDSGWSVGGNLPDAGRPANFPIGSIAVKAAWRPLNEADTPAVRARYYVTRAAVVDVASSRAAGRVVCGERDLALVGLHIVVKTATRAQWIWSSFEHVDNVPPAGSGQTREPDAKDARAPYGFFDPTRGPKLWPPFGAAATEPLDRSNPPKLAPTATQLVRRYPINAALMAINRRYWAQPGIRGTVWEHYMLVAAQWPTSAETPGPENDGAFFPGQAAAVPDDYKAVAAEQENMANTTMESYLQDSPSSCMSCHQAAANRLGFDFVGALAKLK